MKVHIVYGTNGDWDDRVDYPIKCFDDRKVAENYIEHLKSHNARMEKHRDYMLNLVKFRGIYETFYADHVFTVWAEFRTTVIGS